MQELPGYPSIFLYVILLIGLPLAFLKPFRGFLMATFLVSAADFSAFTLTRTSLLGPYFNAHDACLLVALTAMLSYGILLQKGIKISRIVILISAILIIGYLQSLFLIYEYNYEILRILRWAVTLPVYFVISATLVDSEQKVDQFLLSLFLGSVLSAVEHIFYVRSQMDIYLSTEDLSHIRTIAFRSPGIWFLLAGLIWRPKIKWLNTKILLISGSLIALSVLLNQTRSIWISSIATIPLIFILFKQEKVFKKAVQLTLLLTILYAGMLVVAQSTTPSIRPGDILQQRLMTFSDEDLRMTTTISRKLALTTELEEWSNGTLIFGRGLAYYMPDYLNFYMGSRVAWGHLGHITILAQLGIIGMLIYSFYLPLKIVQAAREIWNDSRQSIKYLGLLTGVCIVWSWVCYFMSSSFLEQNAIGGVLFGATWRQAIMLGKEKVQSKVAQECRIDNRSESIKIRI